MSCNLTLLKQRAQIHLSSVSNVHLMYEIGQEKVRSLAHNGTISP